MRSCRRKVLAAVVALQVRNGGKPVSPQEVIREMQQAGTSYPEGMIRAGVVSRMCVNAPDNHATTRPRCQTYDGSDEACTCRTMPPWLHQHVRP